MITKYPYKFHDGKTISPSMLEENFQYIRKAIAHSVAHKLVKRSFIVQLDGLNTTIGTGGENIEINPPFAMVVTGFDLVCLDTSANLTSIKVTFTGDVNDEIECVKGSRESKTVRYAVAAGGDFAIKPEMTTTGAVTLSASYLIVHYTAVRATSYDVGEEVNIRHGDTVDVADLNTEFSNLQSAAADDAANMAACGIWVFPLRVSSAGVASIDSWRSVARIPAIGMSNMRFRPFLHATTLTTARFSFYDPNQGTTTQDVVGLGAGVVANGVESNTGYDQPQDPADVNDDTTITVAVQAGGGFYSSTVVVYSE